MGHLPRLVLLAVLVLASMAAAFYTWRTRDALEGFDEEEARAVMADGGSNYDKRIYIMKIFDALLKRKATAAELEEFSKKGSDSEILTTVLARYKVTKPERYSDAETDTGDSNAQEEKKDQDKESKKEKEKDKDKDQDREKDKEKEKEKEKHSLSGDKKEKEKHDQICLNKHDLLHSLKDITDRVTKFQSLIHSM